jgi:hypothetical protein
LFRQKKKFNTRQELRLLYERLSILIREANNTG